MGKLTQEYGNTEAGKALEAKGFKAALGGTVFRFRRFGVVVDVRSSTGMAPRETMDAVEVMFSTGGTAEDGLVLRFAKLSDFLATLK